MLNLFRAFSARTRPASWLNRVRRCESRCGSTLTTAGRYVPKRSFYYSRTGTRRFACCPGAMTSTGPIEQTRIYKHVRRIGAAAPELLHCHPALLRHSSTRDPNVTVIQRIAGMLPAHLMPAVRDALADSNDTYCATNSHVRPSFCRATKLGEEST